MSPLALSKILPDKTSESEIVTVVQICVEDEIRLSRLSSPISAPEKPGQ